MKKRVLILMLALLLMLPLWHAASANAPAPDPLLVKIQYRNVEVGTVITAMFAGADGVFHQSEYGPVKVSEASGYRYVRRQESDTQLYLEVTHPDGTTVRSNTLPIELNGARYAAFRYDGRTNELTDRTGSDGNCALGYAGLFLGISIVSLAAAFGLTLLIEFLIGLCFRMKPFRYIIFANLITNIPMNIILLLLSILTEGAVYRIALIVLEAIVCLIEFLFWRSKYKTRKAWYVLLFTLTANAVSAAAGLLILRQIF